MRGLHGPILREVGCVERQQVIDSVGHHQRRQARIVRLLTSDLAAVDKFEPTVQNIRTLGQKRELIS
jgi:hypothetical protein